MARKVLDAIDASRHVRANVYLDQELRFVARSDAPGVTRYRQQLDDAAGGLRTRFRMPHEQIIAKLDQIRAGFPRLIIKTELTIPYTSVFFELDCGYWNAEAEERLRKAMAASGAK